MVEWADPRAPYIQAPENFSGSVAARGQAHMWADPALSPFLEKMQKAALKSTGVLFIYYWRGTNSGCHKCRNGILRGENIWLSVSGISIKPRILQAMVGYIFFPSFPPRGQVTWVRW